MSNSIQIRSAKIVKGPSSTECDVVVVGAGPYGLSAGVYLEAKGIDVRVFGEPMDFWANQMPKGMLLRSPREASNIADPGRSSRWKPMKRRPARNPPHQFRWKRSSVTANGFSNSWSSQIDRRVISRISRESSSL